MDIKVNRRFLKDLIKVPVNERVKIEKIVFEESAVWESIESAGIFEKLKGYKSFYKARFGNYRIGVSYSDDTLIFQRVLHRKEIYKYFP